ncbi:hypothetical protein ACFYOT_40495 [Saccharothrix saharensis]|uniref:hypothetical protein n=1 Tax=Saccharothrix saharensis TaxID=571190 RepID=UPI00369C106E
MARRKRSRPAKPTRAASHERERERKPLWKRWWPWVSAAITIALVPLLINLVSAHYDSRLALEQAAEQEARAQAGAEKAKDAELAKEAAVLARVRPVHEEFWAWVFPEPVDESTLRTGGYAESHDERYRIFREKRGVESSASPDRIGGVLKKSSRHQVSLIGNRRETVRILEIRAHVLERTAPLSGALLTYPPQGEGDVREVLFDLDSAERRLLLPDQDQPDAAPKPFFDVKYLNLAKSEEVALDVTAFTLEHHYKWELELTVAYEGVTEEKQRIRSDGTADGPPFETAAWTSHHAGVDEKPVTYRGGSYQIEMSTGGKFERVG